MEDLKFNLKPKLRLIIMIFFLIIPVISNNFYIEETGIKFLNRFLEIDIFSLFFICLCFLFIINGSNLIDGYNGLLTSNRFVEIVKNTGISIIGQTDEICPADRKIYTLRGATNTIASLPLICGSIMSKKIAE